MKFGKTTGRKLTVPDNITASTMLRLETAARIAFPDGSLSLSAMRREAARGRLTTYRIAGKDFTTLADIEELKTTCRVQAKVRDCTSRKPKIDAGSGSSVTASEPSALAALRATAQALKQSLPPTSPQSTIPKPAAAAVIPMPSKSRTP
jgi:hypothetical protein